MIDLTQAQLHTLNNVMAFLVLGIILYGIISKKKKV